MKRIYYILSVIFSLILVAVSVRCYGMRKLEIEKNKLISDILCDMPPNDLTISLSRIAQLIDDPELVAELSQADERSPMKTYISGSWVICVYESVPHIVVSELEFRKKSTGCVGTEK